MTPCPVCAEPTTGTTVPEAGMAVGAVTVRLLRLPILRCRRHHVTVEESVVAALVDRVARDVPAASRTFLRRRDRCAACDAELALPPRRSEKPVPVPVDDAVVTALVEAPYSRCSECGTEQLAPEVGADRLAAAVRAAAHAPVDRA